ncbi:MAG: hypothetical protein CME60_13785 [Halobacteriovoraceae bacterium]|nr:hypothetical protein [Halobacteriovoraceae bacterium]
MKQITKTLKHLKMRLSLAPVLFSLIIFGLYATQIIFKREDWPLTHLSLFSAGRYDTTHTIKISIENIIQENGQKTRVEPLLWGSDKFFIIESLEKIILDRHPNIHDGASFAKDPDTIHLIDQFVEENILPLYSWHQKERRGELIIRLRYWDQLNFQNYHTPEKEEIYWRKSL